MVCALRASDLLDHGLAGLSFTLHWQGETRRLDHAPLLGAHSVYTALAAAAVGLTLGLSFDEVVAALGVSRMTRPVCWSCRAQRLDDHR